MEKSASINQTAFDRSQMLTQVRLRQDWDIVVIGGGATGLGIALDACTRGYSVVLLEQSDFAKGTSSRSTKLIHGGVRYLAQGDIRLVREACKERGLLLHNAPHLVRDLVFVVPVYSWFSKWKYLIGLKIYDWIAGKLRLGPSRFISRKRMVERMPDIRHDGLVGGIEYHDGQFDDARLAINLAQSVASAGGQVLNYTQVTSLGKNEKGWLDAVTAVDLETGEELHIKARAVINATGVFADNIAQMDQKAKRPSVAVSQGTHIVLDRSFYTASEAMMIPKTSDGRVLFAVPWHNKVVVGTTDTPVDNTAMDPVALEMEINFILNTAGSYLTKQPGRSDVLSVFSGLRPLAAPKQPGQKTKEISRSHKIHVSPSKLFTMLGGKWTTYRKMAEDMMDKVEKELGWEHRSSGTASLSINGAIPTSDWTDPFYYYGSDAEAIKRRIKNSNEAWISEEFKIHPEQVRWAVEKEMARTLDDVLSRRTRNLFLDAREALRIAPTVVSIMAQSLGQTNEWQQAQLSAFKKMAANYLL